MQDIDIMDFGKKPTHTVPKHPADTSFPTVTPDPPIFQHRGPAGQQAQWLVSVALGK
jgi:hypothetical protein